MTYREYIDLDLDYWCAFCGQKVPRGQEEHEGLGRPIDWKYRHLLRYKVRNKNKRKSAVIGADK